MIKDISVRLVAISADGASKKVLIEAENVLASFKKNEASTLQFDIPHLSPMGGDRPWGADNQNLIGRYDISFQVNYAFSSTDPGSWVEPLGGRFAVINSAKMGGANGVTTYECLNAVAYDLTGAPNLHWTSAHFKEKDGVYRYKNRTPGYLVRDWIDGARKGGALSKVTRGFDEFKASNGSNWTITDLDFDFSATATASEVMEALADITDWCVEGNKLHLYEKGKMGAKKSLELAFGREFMDMPSRQSNLGVADKVLGGGMVTDSKGKQKFVKYTSDAPPSIRQRSTRGTRYSLLQVPGTDSSKEIQRTVANAAKKQGVPLEEETRPLLGETSRARLPFAAFDVGDSLRVQQGDGEFVDTEIAGITYRLNDVGEEWSVIFGDEVPSTTKRLVTSSKAQGTASVKGPPAPKRPVRESWGVPNPVVVVTAGSFADWDQLGVTTSDIELFWEEPAMTIAENEPAGVDSYRVEGLVMPVPGEPARGWVSWGSTDFTTMRTAGLPPGRTVKVRVQAHNVEGWGAWSGEFTFVTAKDTTPPPVPTVPVLVSDMSQVIVAWDGLFAGDISKPADFARVEAVSGGKVVGSIVRVSDRVVFDPGVVRGEEVSVVFVAVDTSGNRSATSGPASVVVRGVLDNPAIGAEFDQVGASFDQVRSELAGFGLIADGAAADAADALDAVQQVAATVRIDSSQGVLFKSNQISTVLSVTVFKGGLMIQDVLALRDAYGAGAFLEWQWQRMGEGSFGTISSADSRLSQGGFALTLSPADVDTKTVFRCVVNS